MPLDLAQALKLKAPGPKRAPTFLFPQVHSHAVRTATALETLVEIFECIKARRQHYRWRSGDNGESMMTAARKSKRRCFGHDIRSVAHSLFV